MLISLFYTLVLVFTTYALLCNYVHKKLQQRYELSEPDLYPDTLKGGENIC